MRPKVRLGVEQLEDPAKELQEGHAEKFEADWYYFVIPEVSQQDLKSAPGIDARQCLQDAFDEVDISPDGHFEGEAVGEGDVLADGLEDIGILGGDHSLGS